MSKNRLKKIEQKVISFSSQQNLISKNDKILVAFSGGADSAFVLSVLKKYKAKFGIELAAAHVNHGLRGKEADADEKFCAEFAEKLGVEFHSAKVQVKRFAATKKLSLEEAARIKRYEALRKIAKKICVNKIATAHNLNDNAETVLLNLLKGGSPRSVAGIPPRREEIIRPALNVSREEIEFWLAENKIDFATDKTNFENEFLRNRLRNLILPQIRREINPKADEAIFNFSQILASQNEFVEKFASSRAEELFRKSAEGVSLDLSQLNELDLIIFGEIISKGLRNFFNYDISFTDVEKIKSVLQKQKGKRILLGGGLLAVKERKRLVFFIEEPEKETFFEFENEAVIETDGAVISVLKTKRKKKKVNCELISADNLGEKFTLRRWKKGDKFTPLGMKRGKKISDFLTDLKVPASKKKKVLVLENNGKIIWVVGFRISDEVKITDKTKRRMELCANTTI